MSNRLLPPDDPLLEAFEDEIESPSDEEVLATVSSLEVWRTRLLLGSKRGVLSVVSNAILYCRNLPDLKDLFRFNGFYSDILLQRSSHILPGRKPGASLSTEEATAVCLFLADTERVAFSADVVEKALRAVAKESPIEPVQDYLKNLPRWDGIRRLECPRLNSLFGADTADGTADVLIRTWLCGAYQRAMEPGCKFDYMLVLEGEQGIGKSTSLAALVPDLRWYREGAIDPLSKDGQIDNLGVWIREIGELAGLRGADIDRLKGYISRQIDQFRPPYGRGIGYFPRHCALAATVNPKHSTDRRYLVDETGGRRFWPVKIDERPDVQRIKEERDQLWAEVKARVVSGEDRAYLDASWERDVLGPEQEKRLKRSSRRRDDE